MSLYTPSSVPAADLAIAEAPFLGGEFAVYLTNKLHKHIADIELTSGTGVGASVGTLTDDPVTSIATNGEDLQVYVANQLNSSEKVVIVLQGTYDNDALGSGVATFQPPSWATHQGFNFQKGFAVDVVPVHAGRKMKTLTGIGATTPGTGGLTGGTKGNKFGIMTLPALSDFALVGCTTEKDITSAARKSKPIACGMNGSAFTKGGRSEPGTLSVSGKMKTFGDGLARFDGQRCTAMLVGLKEDLLITDRIIATGYWPTVRTRIPDGEDEAMLEAEGNYSEVAYFVAP